MDICPNCGAENPQGSNFCMYCGGNMNQAALSQAQPVQPAENSNNYQQDYNNNYQQPYYNQSPAPQRVPTGGLMTWSIITLLFCTIPGIVAIANTAAINKCRTVEEQQKKIKSVKIWCIVGNIIGVLFIIAQLAG